MPNSDLPHLDYAGQIQSPASSCNPRGSVAPRSHRLSFLYPVIGEPILQLLEVLSSSLSSKGGIQALIATQRLSVH